MASPGGAVGEGRTTTASPDGGRTPDSTVATAVLAASPDAIDRRRAEAVEPELERLRREQVLQDRVRHSLMLALALLLGLLGLAYKAYRIKAQAASEIALKNRELAAAYARVEELSRTDPLTGLPNRRDVQRRLAEERSRWERSGLPFSLAMADIDDFKDLNDAHGHDCGDLVLVLIAGMLRAGLRTQDYVARWGGEEFLLIFPGTPVEGGAAAAEKLRTTIAATELSHQSSRLAVTMTFGISAVQNGDLDACVREADQALIAGKRQGKNRVVLFEGRSPGSISDSQRPSVVA